MPRPTEPKRYHRSGDNGYPHGYDDLPWHYTVMRYTDWSAHKNAHVRRVLAAEPWEVGWRVAVAQAH